MKRLNRRDYIGLTGMALAFGGANSVLGSPRLSANASSLAQDYSDQKHIPALKTHFSNNFKVGMAIGPHHLTEPKSLAILTKHANSIVAENVMKANVIGASQGVYNFALADQLVSFAQKNAMEVRGHALLWHQTSPEWFFAGDTHLSTYKASVRARLETYIYDVVTHYKGKVFAWDVVNEAAIDDASSDYRHSRWYQIFGPDYIDIAFRAARAADPAAKLFINDYNTEYADKRARLMRIIDTMQARGVPIDGVGHQLHVNTITPSAQHVTQALSETEARGLINHITEIDVSFYHDPESCVSMIETCLPSVTEKSAAHLGALKDQARKYRELYAVFASRPSVTSVTTWGVSDLNSWLSSWPIARLNHPLLFDRAGNPKAAFWAIIDPNFVI